MPVCLSTPVTDYKWLSRLHPKHTHTHTITHQHSSPHSHFKWKSPYGSNNRTDTITPANHIFFFKPESRLITTLGVTILHISNLIHDNRSVLTTPPPPVYDRFQREVLNLDNLWRPLCFQSRFYADEHKQVEPRHPFNLTK